MATVSQKLEKEEFFHFCKYLACTQNHLPASIENLNKPLVLANFTGYDAQAILAEQQKKMALSQPDKPNKENQPVNNGMGLTNDNQQAQSKMAQPVNSQTGLISMPE